MTEFTSNCGPGPPSPHWQRSLPTTILKYRGGWKEEIQDEGNGNRSHRTGRDDIVGELDAFARSGEESITAGGQGLAGPAVHRARRPAKPVDLYLPEDVNGALPVVVWIHPGAWQQGSKELCPAVLLVAKGYAVASVNFRLAQDAVFPAQIEDCKAAIRGFGPTP